MEDHNKTLARQKRYRDSHKEKLKEDLKKYRHNNPKIRAEQNKRAHNKLSSEYIHTKNLEYYYRNQEMISEKRKKEYKENPYYTKRHTDNCAICGEHKKMFYDHDHKTGKFRGWICCTCNFGIGHFKDSIEILEKAINYLKRTS